MRLRWQWILISILLLPMVAAQTDKAAALHGSAGILAASTPTGTGSGTPEGSIPAEASFFLYAARVSTVNNPGDLSGLAAVSPGSTVWLMMYYIVKSVPGTMPRITRYTISHAGKTVFHTSFTTETGPNDVGRLSRYTTYALPLSAPYGQYLFQASLIIGTKVETKVWPFIVARQQRMAAPGVSVSVTDRPSFFLYAARVSTVNNPGDLSGLAAVSPGSTVWLMMYYIVKSVPGTMPRITRYTISHAGKTVFHASVQAKTVPTNVGRLRSHLIYHFPRTAPYGQYQFQVTLSIGVKQETKVWSFIVAQRQRFASSA